MSRELNRKQEQIILSEIQRNKVLGLENPYELKSEIYNKLYAENDHETIIQNIDNFINDFRENDDDEFYLDEWQSVKYETWLKEKKLHNSNAVIRGEQIEKMS
tara:strand:+ start:3610 stop:3918 length:309 start_codon:yes stop_codon:yes gene_type:complete